MHEPLLCLGAFEDDQQSKKEIDFILFRLTKQVATAGKHY